MASLPQVHTIYWINADIVHRKNKQKQNVETQDFASLPYCWIAGLPIWRLVNLGYRFVASLIETPSDGVSTGPTWIVVLQRVSCQIFLCVHCLFAFRLQLENLQNLPISTSDHDFSFNLFRHPH